MKAIEQFTINIQRAEELLNFHKTNYPKGRPVSKGVPADLLRAVVVFTVAALDAYMGKRIIEVVSKTIIQHHKISDKCVSRITKKLKDVDTARVLVNIAIQSKPDRKIISLLQESLQSETFQKPDQLEGAFQMMGIKDGWTKIKSLTSRGRGPRRMGRRPDVKKAIQGLGERRDDIVHESDMYFSDKHQGKLKPISRTKIGTELKTLKRVVLAIDKISEIIKI